MELAAAVPQWPWSDLAYSLMPNGSTLDYVTDSPYRGPAATPDRGREASFVTGLYGDRPGDQQLRAAWHRPRRRPDRLVRADQRRRALRLEPAGDGDRRRDHHPPLLLLHRPLDRHRRRC